MICICIVNVETRAIEYAEEYADAAPDLDLYCRRLAAEVEVRNAGQGPWRYYQGDVPFSWERIDAEAKAAKTSGARAQRTALLYESDWRMAPDLPVSEATHAAWATYRQSLRDIPKQKGFPDAIKWPVAPNAKEAAV